MNNNSRLSTYPKNRRGDSAIELLFGLACLAAWITHVYVCFSAAKWGFLIAGAIFFPIAIVHGFGIWINVW
jgi:hypothetical protein